MVTVQEWVGREVHDGIVFTLGPGRLPRRMWGGRMRWREAGSPLAVALSLARPLNRTNTAAGCSALIQWSLMLTCHCLLTSVLVLWALLQCSSCSSSCVSLSHCLISHLVLLSSLAAPSVCGWLSLWSPCGTVKVNVWQRWVGWGAPWWGLAW